MLKLIGEAVDWEGLTGGRVKKEEFTYTLGQGVMHKETGVLVIPMTLNFVLPFDDLLRIKAIVKSRLDFVEDVKFRFSYENVIMNEEEIIRNYLPYLVQILESSGTGYANAVDSEFFEFAEGEDKVLLLRCVGKTICEQLNANVSKTFERILIKNFGLRYKVRFENDEEEYLEKVDGFIQDLQEEKEKFLEENAQKAKEAASKPKENDEDRPFRDGGSNGNGKPEWRRNRKEAKIKDNFIMGRGFTGEPNHSLTDLDPSMGTVIVEGILYKMDSKVIRSGNHVASILITDERTTICLKNFLSEEKWQEISDFLKPGDRLKVQGEVEFDTFENLNVIRFREIEKLESRMDREDTSEIGKRVELHLHTKTACGGHHRPRRGSVIPRRRSRGRKSGQGRKTHQDHLRCRGLFL